MDLSRVKDRESLKAAREPYWQRLHPGCFVGYRPSKRGGAGTWIGRAYDDHAQAYRLRRLGDYGTLDARDRFAEAKKDAEAFFNQIGGGGDIGIETVEQAARQYALTRPDAVGRFERHLYGDVLAKVRLAKLRRSHLNAWRERLVAKPVVVAKSKGGDVHLRPRAPSSVNRDMAVLRAALRKVLPPGPPSTEAAWQEGLQSIGNADNRRTLYLEQSQRQRLVAHTSPEAAAFVRLLCLLPLRPGAAAALRVGDFDKRTSELTVHKDKTGKPRRIVVPAATAAILIEQSANKLPTAYIFTRAGGRMWDRHSWKGPIAQAGREAGLADAVVAYTLRHSLITDLVNASVPILTVAQLSGTSVEMIEKHYGHLVKSASLNALSLLSV